MSGLVGEMLSTKRLLNYPWSSFTQKLSTILLSLQFMELLTLRKFAEEGIPCQEVIREKRGNADLCDVHT